MPEKCDRCIQWGVVEWWLPEGWSRLFMCEHHAREHGPAMQDKGWLADVPAGMWGLEARA